MRRPLRDDLIGAIFVVLRNHRGAIFREGFLAPSGRHHAPAMPGLHRIQIELRNAMAEIARERLAALAEDRLHIVLALHHHHHRGVMQDIRMVAVHRIFERHLPVALVGMFEHARSQNDFTRGREIHELID